jgi:phospholipid/cholesterol/gamma-HCH transport system substrate-binding protein
VKRFNVEVAVGLFMIVGFVSFAWLAVKLGDVSLFGGDSYGVEARFTSISGLKEGALVEIAGVRVGKVTNIVLDGEDYEAVVSLAIDSGVKLQDDIIASIRTAGVIGDKFIDLTPGGSEEFIGPEGEIFETESSISLEKLISKYMFEKD